MSHFRFLSEASEELQAAAEYYDAQSIGLGRELVIEVRRLCRMIAESPQVGRPVRPDIRRRLVRRFPYSVTLEQRQARRAETAPDFDKRRATTVGGNAD